MVILLSPARIGCSFLCRCSKGDNITPLQQALGSILDLYGSDEDILTAGQIIVYAVHEAIGYIWRFERRALDDIRAMGGDTPDEERCLAGGPLQDDTGSRLLELERMFTSQLPAGVSKFFHNNKKEWVNRSMVNPFTLLKLWWS